MSLDRELEKNLALKVEPTDSADKFLVFGRGVLHLSVLIETMRREGYELQIGQPQVITKELNGVKCEPFEEMTIDLPEVISGKAIEIVSIRKGEIIGEHEVKFSSGKEIITLNHEAFDRALYSEGALSAAKWLMHKKPGLYSMRDLLNFD